MDFELSDEHKLFRDTVYDFAQNEIAPGALERDKTHEFPHDIITKMARLGLMGIPFPEDYGGSGGGTHPHSISVEENSPPDGPPGPPPPPPPSFGAPPFFPFCPPPP